MQPSDPNRRIIPLSTPHMGGAEWRYVKDCLDTNWVSYAGEYVERFEAELAHVTGAPQVVATNSGTSALHLALLVAGVQPDTEVIMPAISFVAPANAVRYCGAWPTFVDLSPSDWQMDVDKLEDFLASCRRGGGKPMNPHTGRRIAALMPVHLLGAMCDVDRIAGLARDYALPLIEDGAQCLGARYRERSFGSPPAVDVPVWLATTSFNGNKIITTGGGGAVFASDEKLASLARHLSTTAKTDGIEFFHDRVGYNYRLTNVAAGIGLGQLELLCEHVKRKREIAAGYRAAFDEDGRVVFHAAGNKCQATHWMATAMLPQDAPRPIAALVEQGIQCRPIWKPLNRLPAFDRDCYADRLEFAEMFQRRGIMLPCSVNLSDGDRQQVIAALLESLSR